MPEVTLFHKSALHKILIFKRLNYSMLRQRYRRSQRLPKNTSLNAVYEDSLFLEEEDSKSILETKGHVRVAVSF